MKFFRNLFRRASDKADNLVEPVHHVSNAMLVGGITAGLIVGGAYVYSRVRKKQD
jgi:hypothetical protein